MKLASIVDAYSNERNKMKIKLLSILYLCTTALYANDLIFAIGKWLPYTGKNLAGYGITTQKVKKICNKANLKCKFEFMPWKRAFNATKSGEYDGTFPWEPKGKIKKYFIVSPTIEKTKVVAFGFNQLPGDLRENHTLFSKYTVAGVNGYVFPEILKKEGAGIYMLNSSESAWNMLKHKRVDAYLDDIVVGKYECRTFTPAICEHLKISEPLFVSDMSILFTKKGQNSKNIEKFLKIMR